MNHDYAHCLDFKKSCPRKCFRAQQCRDLMVNFIPIPLTWQHFKGGGGCPLEKKEGKKK